MQEMQSNVVCKTFVLESSNSVQFPLRIPGGIYTHCLKRYVDIFVSLVALVCCLPLFLVVAVYIKQDSKGPIFYSQDRVGKDGKLFRIFKFRTMTHEDTPQITKLGKFLRDTKIDELPQLVNVLLGDMSIIGPRPLWTRCTNRLIEQGYPPEYPGFFHHVSPGLIGLEQINRWRFKDIDKAYPARFELNQEYEENFSWQLDLYILFKSIIQCRTVCGMALASAAVQALLFVTGYGL